MADYSDNEDLKDEVSKLNLIVDDINHKIKEMKKSEILFLYETSYNIPNGDPFTGEQRYDEETKKFLLVMFELRDLSVHILRILRVNISMFQKTLELVKQILKVY